MRRTELILIVGLAVAVVLAAIAGRRAAPDEALTDRRRSVRLHGPAGASGVKAALERLGVPVEERRTALFGLAAERRGGNGPEWLALLDLAHLPSRVEAREVALYVAQGGRLLVAGQSGVERCFGFRVERLRPDEFRDRGVALRLVPGTEALPHAQFALRRIAPDTTEEPGEDCTAAAPERTVPLLRTVTGRFVASRLDYAGGGQVILLADADFVANEAVRATDAGVVVLSWLLEPWPARVIVDEYHQGFGRGGSLFAAAWRWLVAAPAGWMILQAAAAALLGLLVLALRFGPAVRVIERRRRSPLEHVEALAVGLERAGARDTAVSLMVSGLRRRLGRAGGVRATRRGGDPHHWLASLELAARTPEARAAVRRLAKLMREPGGDQRVLAAATAAEDVWNSLGQANGSGRSSRR